MEKLCKYKEACPYLKKGNCKFYHPEVNRIMPPPVQNRIRRQPQDRFAIAENSLAPQSIENQQQILPQKDHFISGKKLEEWSMKSSNELQEIFYGMPRLLEKLSGTRLEKDIPKHFVEILHKIIGEKDSSLSNKILASFIESKFFDNLGIFLKKVNNNLQQVQQILRYLPKLLLIMKVFIDLFPTHLHQLPISELFMTVQLSKRAASQDDYGKNQVKEVEAANLELEEAYFPRFNQQSQELNQNKGGSEKKKEEDKSYEQMPADDFTKIDILPSGNQLIAQKVLIRRMPEKGDCKTKHNYLDIVFKLLREDATKPLVDGIEYLRMSQSMNKKDLMKGIRDTQLKMYNDIVLNGISLQDGSACLEFRLYISSKKFIDWRISKKLLPGSLVALSCDSFNEIFMGITKGRNAKQMNYTHKKYGFVILNIEIITDNQESVGELFMRLAERTFQMLESSAYFESYQHVLKKLKYMDSWATLPLEKYCVNATPEIQRPAYITDIMTNQGIELENQIVNLSLDKSQLAALRLAFQNELALIQGPPGTGKTYVGMQLVKILLNFKDQWRPRGPMLIVTYTNHALDQFINLIKDFNGKIVRIGGRCDDSLQHYTLIDQCKMIKHFPSYRRVLDKLKDHESNFKNFNNALSQYQIGIVTNLLEKKENVLTLIEALESQFPRYVEKHLQQYGRNQSLSNNVWRYINKQTKDQNNNFIIQVWLQLIDIQKLIFRIEAGERPVEQTSQQLNQMRLEEQKGSQMEQNLNGDFEGIDFELEERELDYEQKSTSSNNEDLTEKVIGVLEEQFDPSLASYDYMNAETFQECVIQGRAYGFLREDLPQNRWNDIQDLFYQRLDIKWKTNNSIINSLIMEEVKFSDRMINQYSNLYKDKNELDNLRADKVLKKADIIAMTTTGRAKYQELLKNYNFPISIVEEAAEVFEGHIVSSLSRNTEHLILIGDHEQLRPNPAVYELSKHYNLSMSMFERLINNQIQHSTLQFQRRMRPEIAKIMKFIYPDLEDHEKVITYPSIRGLATNLFFFDHNFQESTHDLMMSKFNIKEAEIIVRFTNYLLQQKYEANKITILTLYTGQLLQIKKIIGKNNPFFKNVRVCNVDNFQGEENDIIILSLVRSNPANNIGYLKISNRVCVALSRAKHGLYIFGNSKCLLGSKMELWEKVISYLKENSFLGNELVLKCLNHEAIARIKTVEDFTKVPEGGCLKICGIRLECGHACQTLCHPYFVTLEDKDGHNDKKCLKNCDRVKECKHPCSFQCYECKKGCKPCITKVKKNMGACGHIMEIKCHEYPTTFQCKMSCDKILPCKHKCQKDCYQDCSKFECKVSVERELPCKHIVDMDCSISAVDFFRKGNCFKDCEKILPCGHKCPRKCGKCTVEREHGRCSQKCSRNLICGHQCTEPCTKNCPPCRKQCITRCSHSSCPKNCGEVCTLCQEPCNNSCIHQKCTKVCSQPCDRKPCNEPCQNLLKCGHFCIGLCGEDCPRLCRACQPTNDTFQIFFGNEDAVDARFVVIDCGHIFEVIGLDKHMSMKTDNNSVQFKACPICRTKIMKCRRYQNQINQTLNDINAVKQLIMEKEELFLKGITDTQQLLKQLISKVREYDRTKQTFQNFEQRLKLIDDQLKKVQHNRTPEQLTPIQEKVNLERDLITFAIYLETKESSTLSIFNSGRIRLTPNKILENYLRLAFLNIELIGEEKSEIKKLAQQLREQSKIPLEMEIMINAIGLSKGHWYKCPNGHYYVIGECGGANQKAKCPDCKTLIGGQDHALAQGNSHASEFGGSSAWDPEGFNARVMNGEIDLERI